MQDSKTKIIIIILIVLIFLVGIGGTILYLTTDMFKSSQVLFQKYISNLCCDNNEIKCQQY